MKFTKILFNLIIIFSSNIIYSRTIIPTYSITQINQVLSNGFINAVSYCSYKIQSRKEDGQYPGKYIFSCCNKYAQKLDINLNVAGAYAVNCDSCYHILPCKLGSRSIIIVSTIFADNQITVSVLDQNGNYQKKIDLKYERLPFNPLEVSPEVFAMSMINSTISWLYIWNFKEDKLFKVAFPPYVQDVYMLKASEGQFIVAYSNNIELWSADGYMIRRIELGTFNSPHSYQISAIKKLNSILTVAFENSGKIRTFDIDSLNELEVFDDLGVDYIANLCKSKDNKTLVALYQNYNNDMCIRKVFILDVESRCIINSFDINIKSGWYFNLAVVPNSQKLIYVVIRTDGTTVYLGDFNGNLLASTEFANGLSQVPIKFLSDDTFCIQGWPNLTLFKINSLNNPKNNLLIKE